LERDRLPKNFEKIISVAQEILSIVQEYASQGKDDWLEKYEDRWSAAVEALVFQIRQNKSYTNLLSDDDVRDRLRNISFETGKSLKDINLDDLRKIIEDLLRSKRFDFYFPQLEAFDFPDGYELGYCALHNFEHLPGEVKTSITSNWKFEYDEEKQMYHVRSTDEYEKAKKQETYLCLSVTALGIDKATEIATTRANQSFNILKCTYPLEHLPRLKRCHWFTEGMSGSVGDFRYKLGWFRHSSSQIQERYIQNLTDLMKNGTDQIAKRCVTSLDIYGMIERETPLKVRFLLSVIATEGLLLGDNDRDVLGWKLREKVAILLGDTPALICEYMKRDVMKEGLPSKEECDANRVASRAALAKKVGDLYNKRSRFAHADAGGKYEVTEEDFEFASMIFRLSMQRLLTLRQEGIIRVEKQGEDALDSQSLDSFIDSLKYSVPLGAAEPP
jgi:hypothetical protein